MLENASSVVDLYYTAAGMIWPVFRSSWLLRQKNHRDGLQARLSKSKFCLAKF